MARTERVVFVPGFMQRGDAWAPVAELVRERYPSILVDHAEYTAEGRLQEIAEAAGGPGPGASGAVLAGYSLGGRLALHAALRFGHFRALVTVGATAGIEDAPARAARREADDRLAGWMERSAIEQVVDIWERQPLFADQSEALVESQRAGRLSHDPEDLASLLRSAGQGVLEPLWGELHRLPMPLLALSGSRDVRYTEAARRMGREALHGRAAVVEEAGHAAHLERPEVVARLVLDFIDGL